MHQSPLEARFWSYVDKNGPQPNPNLGPCWIWTGCKLKLKNQPYGLFNWNGILRRTHRISWEIFNGPIPVGMNVCHKCDNPPCINPKHLFLGSQSDNISDAFRKGRLPKIHGRGAKNAFHKLTEVDAIHIRFLAQIGQNQKLIAQEFHVSQSTVSAIKRGVRWNYL